MTPPGRVSAGPPTCQPSPRRCWCRCSASCRLHEPRSTRVSAKPPARFAAWERDESGARRAAGCARAVGARCHRGPARFPRGGLRRELCGAGAGGERVNTAKQAGLSAALLAARREKISRGDAVPSRGCSPPAAPGTFPLPEGPAGFVPCCQGRVGSSEVARLRTGGCGWDLGLGIEPSGAQRHSHQHQNALQQG